MNERKKLKKQLFDKYFFKMYLSVNEVKKLLSKNPKDKHDTLFASLTVGCVKIDAVVFPTPDKMLLGFDILVKGHTRERGMDLLRYAIRRNQVIPSQY